MRCDIEQVVSSYVNLKRRGRHLVGLCPFHSEKTPSFTVFPDNQNFFCFGCNAGGDSISFIKRIENLEYLEAVKLLATKAGMEVPENVRDDATAKMRGRILEINRETARFFHQCLMSPVGKAAYTYISGRGLSDKTLRRFGVGFAPDSWDSLHKHLKSLGFSSQELLAANVISKGKNGGEYDFFRNRLMFPIIDLRGNVIAFGGRRLSENGPKYMNSPETMVYKKGKNLFALNIAKGSRQNKLILCEGYMDVIAIHQAGFDNAVAPLGTALTAEQARVISTYVSEVVIADDADEAGQKATKRAIQLLDAVGVKTRVLVLSDAKDPDEYISKFGAQRFGLLVNGSANAIEYQLLSIKGKYDITTSDGKVSFLKEALGVLCGIHNHLERDVYITKLSQELEVSRDAIVLQLSEMQKRRDSYERKKQNARLDIAALSQNDKVNPQRRSHLRAAIAEERLIALLFSHPDYYDIICKKLKPQDFVTDFNGRVYAILSQRLENRLPVDMTVLGSVLNDEEMGKISGIVASASGAANTRETCEDYIRAILKEKASPNKDDVAQMDDAQLGDLIEQLAKGKK